MSANTWAVILCVWQRPERLAGTLQALAGQTDRAFDLYLVDNNPGVREFVDDLCDRAWVAYGLAAAVIHHSENRYCFARVELAHELVSAGRPYTHLLFVDDDQEFGPGYVAECKREARDDALVGWRGWWFDGHYWERHEAEPGGPCQFVVGCGMIAPAAVFRDPAVLAIPPGCGCMDDLWLSYYANHVLGLALWRGRIASAVVVDGKDCNVLYSQKKVELLAELRRRGWPV